MPWYKVIRGKETTVSGVGGVDEKRETVEDNCTWNNEQEKIYSQDNK